MSDKNLSWHEGKINKNDRRDMNGHQSAVIWLTGLSGSGKSTISVELEKELFQQGIQLTRLDGDNIRTGLNNDLSFSKGDRKENIRRIGEVSKLFVDAGLITVTAFISPYRQDRQMVKDMLDSNEFIEVYVKCDLSVCQSRDPKGLYQKVNEGKIQSFTGIHEPYEEPTNPSIILETDKKSIEESVATIINYLKKNRYIN